MYRVDIGDFRIHLDQLRNSSQPRGSRDGESGRTGVVTLDVHDNCFSFPVGLNGNCVAIGKGERR